jgi:hypothetical protein
VVGAGFAAGQELARGVTHGATGYVARIRVDRVEGVRTTRSVIAGTHGGDPLPTQDGRPGRGLRGVAGAPYDACSRLACDRFDNNSAAAHAVLIHSKTRERVR